MADDAGSLAAVGRSQGAEDHKTLDNRKEDKDNQEGAVGSLLADDRHAQEVDHHRLIRVLVLAFLFIYENTASEAKYVGMRSMNDSTKPK